MVWDDDASGRRAATARRLLGASCALTVVAGVLALCIGVAEVAPDATVIGGYADVAAAVEEAPEAERDSVARAALQDYAGWIRVEGTGIDFPFAQCGDNYYYLKHDLYGNESHGGVFADYRCDVDGRDVVVYGHTLVLGGMFTELTGCADRGTFNSVGSIDLYTPGSGWRTYRKLCALNVDRSRADERSALVQQFSFLPNDDDVAAAGGDASEAELARFRSWLSALVAASDVSVPGAETMAAQAQGVCMTMCCTGADNGSSAVYVCVR